MENVESGSPTVSIDDVVDLVREVLKNRKGGELALSEETEIEALELSSLQMADVVFGLEERRGVQFKGSRVGELRTLGELVDLANESMPAAAAGSVGEERVLR